MATNNIDIGPVPSGDVDYVSTLPGFEIIERLPARWLSVGMNPSVGNLFHNVEARYAVAHAIDKQALINVVYDGNAEIMHGPSSKACWDYDPDFDNVNDVYAIGYDLDLAKMYAERAGIAGKEARIITSGSVEHVQTAEMLQSMLKEIGLTLVIQNYDAAGWGDAREDPERWEMTIEGGFTPTMVYLAGIVDISRMCATYAQEDAWEECAWWNAEAPLVYSMLDPAERHAGNMKRIQIYCDQCFCYSMIDLKTFTAAPSNLQNVYFGQNGVMMYRLLRLG